MPTSSAGLLLNIGYQIDKPARLVNQSSLGSCFLSLLLLLFVKSDVKKANRDDTVKSDVKKQIGRRR